MFYRFPTDPQSLSVGANGDLNLGLEVPTFPGYVRPNLKAVYSSHGGDGVMGMGWDIPVEAIAMDFSDTREALTSPPAANLVKGDDGRRYLRGRWLANNAGRLVCENPPGTRDSAAWRSMWCVASPRTPTRYQVKDTTDDGYELSFESVDPNEGIIKEYGATGASRVGPSNGHPVIWLVSSERNRFGARVDHFYEERSGSDERLRVAVTMGGDKTVRFLYTRRDDPALTDEPTRAKIQSDFKMGVRRTSEHLLTEIQLLDHCTPVQKVENGDIYTDFVSGCGRATLVEKVVITYRKPEGRYTGRYVPATWQHSSGDGRTSYKPVEFEYQGDDFPAKDVNIARPADTRFELPAGYTTLSSGAFGPYQNWVDWNRDGLPDWISTKRNKDAWWPNYVDKESCHTVDLGEGSSGGSEFHLYKTYCSKVHRLYVNLRNASGAFDTSRSYEEPMAHHAVWMSGEDASWSYSEDPNPPDQSSTVKWSSAYSDAARLLSDAHAHGWSGDAALGIDVGPFIYRYDGNPEDNLEYKPIFDTLAMTVDARRFDKAVYQALRYGATTFWPDWCGGALDGHSDCEDEFHSLGVGLSDLRDMDGDGYLDRVMSGLLVRAEDGRFRNPLDEPPAIYVSFFDHASDRFKPFVKYHVPDLPASTYQSLIDKGADPGKLRRAARAMLSTLAFEVVYNQKPGTADGSGQGAPNALMRALGLASGLLNLSQEFPQVSAAFASPSHRQAQGFGPYLAAIGMAGTVVNMYASATGKALPEVSSGMRDTMLFASTMTQTLNLASGAQELAAGGLSGAQLAAGWMSWGNAAVGALGALVGFGVSKGMTARLTSPGVNAPVVAHNLKVTVTTLQIVTGVVSLGVAVGLIASGNPVAGAIGALIALCDLVYGAIVLAQPDGAMKLDGGTVEYKTRNKRGVEYTRIKDLPGGGTDTTRDDTVTTFRSYSLQRVAWVDFTGDGRPDLVLARAGAAHPAFDIAPGSVAKGWSRLSTQSWHAWSFDASDAGDDLPDHLSASGMRTQYVLGHLHRADLGNAYTSLIDLNGDGLVDLVQADVTGRFPQSDHVGGWAPHVYLNSGIGFSRRQIWSVEDGQAGYPAHIRVPMSLGRTRSLSWTEFQGSELGYSVSLSSTIGTIGPDINQDGLPDVVLKDELSYDYMNANGACNIRYGDDVQSWVRPVNTEPGDPDDRDATCNKSQWAANVWFTNFDDYPALVADSSGEGYSHLTRAALDVYGPQTPGDQYVAFNTGHGFTAFRKIGQKLPSLGGGITVMKTTNSGDGVMPSGLAISGTTNSLADPDARGRAHLVTLGIEAAEFKVLGHAHSASSEFVVGIDGPDQLKVLRYPESGTVRFEHTLVRDPKGEQGPPIWALGKASFDDRVTGSQSRESALPFIEYAYRGGLLADRELRGFEAILETRWTGTDLTQVLRVQEQNGNARGQVLCTETRGETVHTGETFWDTNGDGIVGKGDAEGTSCGESRSVPMPLALREVTRQPIGQPGHTAVPDSEPTSCYDAVGRFDVPRIYPLLKRVKNSWETGGSVREALDDGTTGELSRDAVLKRQVASTFDGSSSSVDVTLDVEYDRPPYRTPVLSRITTSDGTRRSVATTWQHKEADWQFLKVREARRDAADAPVLVTSFTWQASSPYALLAREEADPAGAGPVRRREIVSYDAGGLPTEVREAGVTHRYRYFPDGANGTGLLARHSRSPDAFMTAVDAAETYTYDVRGRTLTHTDFTGREDRTEYDDLGLVSRRQPAGSARIEYRYADVGTVRPGRSTADISASQRTIETSPIDGERFVRTSFWDGFGRLFRSGRTATGARTVRMDFDGDGTLDRTISSTADADWFRDRDATTLLGDVLLDARGEARCRSLSYLDGRDPEAWSMFLHDPLGRETFRSDFMGFRTWTSRYVRGGHAVEFQNDDLDEWMRSEKDALERRTSVDEAGLLSSRFEYADWDGLVRRVDGRGFATLFELDPWNQVLRTCRQVDAAHPAPGTRCPENPDFWPTETRTFDVQGLVTSLTDPSGNVTKTMNSAVCKAPGRVALPAIPETLARFGAPVTTVRFDASCRPVEVRELNGSTTRNEYDGGGRLVRTTRAAGLPEETTSTAGYDELGRPLYSGDGTLHRTYSIRDFRDGVTDLYAPEGMHAVNRLDLEGRASSTVDATGLETQYRWDRNGVLLEKSWPGEACDLTAFTPARIAVAPIVKRERFRSDAKGRLIEGIDPSGVLTQKLVRDKLGRVVRSYATSLTTPSTWDPATYAETAYDAAGNVVASRDYAGTVSTFTWDGANRRTVDSVPVSATLTATTRHDYHPNGTLRRVHGPLEAAPSPCEPASAGPGAHTVEFAYAPDGQVVAMTGPSTATGSRPVTRYLYDAAGHLRESVDALGNVTRFEYDAVGRRTAIRHPDGTTTTMRFDKAGRVASSRDARDLETAWVRDGLGRAVRVQEPGGGVSTFAYDGHDQVVQQARLVDAATSQWIVGRRGYSKDGLLVSTAQATWSGPSPAPGSAVSVLSQAHTCYDASGRVQGAEDAASVVRTTEYDARGRIIGESLPATATAPAESVRTSYDARGWVTDVSAPMGGSGPARVDTHYEYDLAGNVVRETATQLQAARVWTYDAAGRMCLAGDESAGALVRRLALTYDPRGKVVGRTATPGATERLDYDDFGSLRHVEDASGSWDFHYDAMNRVDRQTQSVAALGMSFDTTFGYDPNGGLASMGYPAIPGFSRGPGSIGYELETGSNRIGRTLTAAGTLTGSHVYDAAGRTRAYRLVPAGADVAIDYDPAGRRRARSVRVSGTAVFDQAYEYDSVGNLTGVADGVDPRFGAIFRYDRRRRLVQARSPAAGGIWRYAFNSQDLPERFDAPTAAKSRTFAYDPVRGTLAQATEGAITYAYTADDYGNRASTTRDGAAYFHDALNRLVRVQRGADAIETVRAFDGRRISAGSKVYLYGLGALPIAELDVSSGRITAARANVYVDGALVQVVDAATGAAETIVEDPVGSPVLAMSGTSTASQAFGPWGNGIPRPAPTSPGPATPIGFQRTPLDDATGFSVMLHRNYDPFTAQFTTPDPSGLEGGTTRYAFANGNPLRFADPTGLESVPADYCYDNAAGELVVWHARAFQVPIWQILRQGRRYDEWVPLDDVPGGGHWVRFRYSEAKGFHDGHQITEQQMLHDLNRRWLGNAFRGLSQDEIGRSIQGRTAIFDIRVLGAILPPDYYEAYTDFWDRAETQAKNRMPPGVPNAEAMLASTLHNLADPTTFDVALLVLTSGLGEGAAPVKGAVTEALPEAGLGVQRAASALGAPGMLEREGTSLGRAVVDAAETGPKLRLATEAQPLSTVQKGIASDQQAILTAIHDPRFSGRIESQVRWRVRTEPRVQVEGRADVVAEFGPSGRTAILDGKYSAGARSTYSQSLGYPAMQEGKAATFLPRKGVPSAFDGSQGAEVWFVQGQQEAGGWVVWGSEGNTLKVLLPSATR